MKIITINANNKEEVVVSDALQNEDEHINIYYDIDDKNRMILKCGDNKEYVLNKKKTTIIFDRENEKENFKKYISLMKDKCKVMRKFYKESEVFYHNFPLEVKTIESIESGD